MSKVRNYVGKTVDEATEIALADLDAELEDGIEVGALLCGNPRANGAGKFTVLADELAVRRDEDAASTVLSNVVKLRNA